MGKKKLSEIDLLIKKSNAVGKKYTDLKLSASKLNKYEKSEANEGYLKTIILSAAKTQAAAEADPNRIEIDQPKDFLLKSKKLLIVEAGTGENEGKLLVVKEDGKAVDAPYEAPAQITKAGAYLDLVVNTVDDDETDRHTIVDLSMFIDVYVKGNGIKIDDHVISIALRKSGEDANSGLAFGEDGNLYIAINTAKANGLAIGPNGLELGLAEASTDGEGGKNGVMSAQDKENLDYVVEATDMSLATDAEIASWYGFDITGELEDGSDAAAIKAALDAVSDDSITDED